MPARTAWLVAFALWCWFAHPAPADERSDTAAKQKDVALSNLAKLGVAKPSVHETDDLFVGGALTADKLKSLGEGLQKHYAATYKALNFEANEPPWKGKLAVYVFTERTQFTSFIRQVEQRRPEGDETASSQVRSDVPHVALTTAKGDGATLETSATAQVAIALLSRKAGVAELPPWFSEAFARAVRMRTDPKTGSTEKAAIRKVVLAKTRPMPVKPTDGWAQGDMPDKALIATSVIDYLVFGPEAAKFPSVLAGFRESDENPNPTIDAALKSAGFTPEGLEKAWKKWVQTGK